MFLSRIAPLILLAITVSLPVSAQTQPAYSASSKSEGAPFDLVVTETARFPGKSYVEVPGFHQRSAPGARWLMCAFRAITVERGFSHWFAVYPPQSSTRIVVGFANESSASPADILGTDYARERLLGDATQPQPGGAGEDRTHVLRRADAKFLGDLAGGAALWSVAKMAAFCGSTASMAARNCATLKGDAAISACDEALRQNPAYAPSHYNRGLEYSKKGDHDRAIADFTKVIGFTPKYPKVYVDRGNAFHEKGDLDKAFADFSTALQLDRSDADAYYARGNVYSDKGDFHSAVTDFTQAIVIAPRDPRALNARCWLRATKNRDLALALADCNAAIRLLPGDSQIRDSRGLVHLRLGRLNEAIADFDRALELNSKLAGSLYCRGLAKMKKGDKAGGEADIAAAKAITPGIAEEYAKYGVN